MSERGNLFSLYLKIDTEKVECLNEESEGSGKDVFKPWDQRLDTEKVILHSRSEYERLLGNFDSVADRGGVPRGPCPPSPVEISHKKDGCQRRPHRFHVSCPPPPPPSRWFRCCLLYCISNVILHIPSEKTLLTVSFPLI